MSSLKFYLILVSFAICQAEPFLETYWESYLSFPYDEYNCYPGNNEENPVDKTAFGFNLRELPLSDINVINIAFLVNDNL